MTRRGFTLIELLAAISIILVLAGLAIYGISRAVTNSHIATTRTRMESLKSMIAEYEMKTRFTSRPNVSTSDPNGRWWWQSLPSTVSPNYAPAGTDDFWHDVHFTGGVSNPLAAPALVSDVNNDRFYSDAVRNTQLAMIELLRIPSNATAFAKLPASALMKDINGNPIPANQGPILLDSWNNPIIFVPAAGLGQVTVGGNTNTIQGTNIRPYFASAGPDSTFQNGDDNLYSFEQ